MKHFKLKAAFAVPILYILVVPFLFPKAIYDRLKAWLKPPKPKEYLPQEDVEFEKPD